MPLSDISFFHLGSRLDVGQPGGSVSEPSLAFKSETRRLAPHMVRPPRVPSVGTGTQAPRNGPGPSPSSSGSTPPRGRRNGTGNAGTGHGRTAGRGVATSPSGPGGDGPQCLVEERMETSLGRRKLASMSGSGGRRLRSVLGLDQGYRPFLPHPLARGRPKGRTGKSVTFQRRPVPIRKPPARETGLPGIGGNPDPSTRQFPVSARQPLNASCAASRSVP